MSPRTPMPYELAGRTVLVTGATGFIGRHLTPRLIRQGARVRALVRTPAKAGVLPDGVERLAGDVTDAPAVARAVEGVDAVVHLANVVARPATPETAIRNVNVTGTRLVAEAALAAGVARFLHVSSVAVYGFPPGPETDERSPQPMTGDAYADTKREAEALVLALVGRGLPAVVVQPSEVYGPHDEAWTLTPFRLAKAGKLVLPDRGRGLTQPIYIDDAVEGMVAALHRGRAGEAYILSGPAPVPISTFLGYLARLAGRDHVRSVPTWLALVMGSVWELQTKLSGKPPAFTRQSIRYVTRRTAYRHAKAERELGFRPTITVEQGMGRVARWMRDKGLI